MISSIPSTRHGLRLFRRASSQQQEETTGTNQQDNSTTTMSLIDDFQRNHYRSSSTNTEVSRSIARDMAISFELLDDKPTTLVKAIFRSESSGRITVEKSKHKLPHRNEQNLDSRTKVSPLVSSNLITTNSSNSTINLPVWGESKEPALSANADDDENNNTQPFRKRLQRKPLGVLLTNHNARSNFTHSKTRSIKGLLPDPKESSLSVEKNHEDVVVPATPSTVSTSCTEKTGTTFQDWSARVNDENARSPPCWC